MSKFSTFQNFSISAEGANDLTIFSLRGDVASITPAPEPMATTAAVAAGLACFALWRRKRIPAA